MKSVKFQATIQDMTYDTSQVKAKIIVDYVDELGRFTYVPLPGGKCKITLVTDALDLDALSKIRDITNPKDTREGKFFTTEPRQSKIQVRLSELESSSN